MLNLLGLSTLFSLSMRKESILSGDHMHYMSIGPILPTFWIMISLSPGGI